MEEQIQELKELMKDVIEDKFADKVDISKIKDTYDSMNIKVQRKLAEILYHNLPKVRIMYQKILDINILQSEDDMRFFNCSVDIRHDLVHRNGRKGTNSRVDEFHNITLDMINELITRVDLLINEVERIKQQGININDFSYKEKISH